MTILRTFLKGTEIYQWPTLILSHTGIKFQPSFLSKSLGFNGCKLQNLENICKLFLT